MTSPKKSGGFVGRKYELGLLEESRRRNGASLVVVYGRRRVGKTRLVTEFYKGKNLWKFDGLEEGGTARQIGNFLDQLSKYTGDAIYRSLDCGNWIDLIKILDRAVAEDPAGYDRTVFLDEFQYMATRREDLVSAIKWAWDNLWSDKKGFALVLCGSVASFMIKRVVKSSALYGRVNLEICLGPFNLQEVRELSGGRRSLREVCDLYMFCGGIPEYLLQINKNDSVTQNISRLGLCKDGYFVREFDKLFKDIFREEGIYKRIIMTLCRYRSLKMSEITQVLKKEPGGGFVEYLENLESAGFVKGFIPFNRPIESKLKRFRLDDEYLLFYFKFIYPRLGWIRENTDIRAGLRLLSGQSYKSWAGFAFERLCIKHAGQIAKALKIDQLVKNYGAYFDRGSNTKDGVQIDLLFERHDPVVTVCEMKYLDGKIGKWIIDEMERKVALLREEKKTVEKVLITTGDVTRDLMETNYFSRVLHLEDLFAQNIE